MEVRTSRSACGIPLTARTVAAQFHATREQRIAHEAPGLAELDELPARWAAVKVAIERGEGLLVEHLQQPRLHLRANA